jgi:hypothetical protein
MVRAQSPTSHVRTRRCAVARETHVQHFSLSTACVININWIHSWPCVLKFVVQLQVPEVRTVLLSVRAQA